MATIQKAMAEAGMESVDLSDDEFAKSHVRHMVGGKMAVEHERIFRFGESSSAFKCPHLWLTISKNSPRDPEHYESF